MLASRIGELLAPFLGNAGLDEVTLSSISIYIDILQRWNPRINLTAVREAEAIVTRHFGESFFAARLLFPAGDEKTSLADFGSGAGFPGVPCKLWAPDLRVTLIEAHSKKVAFLREALRAIRPPSDRSKSINVFAGRAEDLLQDPDHTSGFDVVTLRAVEQFDRALPTACRLVASRGRAALLIGEEQASRVPALGPTFAWHDPVSLPGSDRRVALVGDRKA